MLCLLVNCPIPSACVILQKKKKANKGNYWFSVKYSCGDESGEEGEAWWQNHSTSSTSFPIWKGKKTKRKLLKINLFSSTACMNWITKHKTHKKSCYCFLFLFVGLSFLFYLFSNWFSLLTLKKLSSWGVLIYVPLLQTDTASVLFEAIGYIRFLQGQIEVIDFLPLKKKKISFYKN